MITQVNQDTALQLRKAKFPQDRSYFNYVEEYSLHTELPKEDPNWMKAYPTGKIRLGTHFNHQNPRLYAAAPSVEELLRELPKFLGSGEYTLVVEMDALDNEKWAVQYMNADYRIHSKYHATDIYLAEALARLWIKLKKGGEV